MPNNNNMERLAGAGIIDAANVTAAEREVIDALTHNEVTVLMQVAARLYADDPTALTVANLRTGRLRILFPL
jgi:hypothetical protein